MISPTLGTLTSLSVVIEHWTGVTPSGDITPHLTGNRCASTSSSGRWHAALIAMLLVDTSGTSPEILKNDMPINMKTVEQPT